MNQLHMWLIESGIHYRVEKFWRYQVKYPIALRLWRIREWIYGLFFNDEGQYDEDWNYIGPAYDHDNEGE